MSAREPDERLVELFGEEAAARVEAMFADPPPPDDRTLDERIEALFKEPPK